MPTDLILSERPTNTKIGPLAEIADRASEFIHQSKAKNTIRAYRADWTHFEGWCKAHGQASLPATADTVALYVSDLAATHKPSTITRRISAISQVHQIAGMETPTGSAKVRLVMAGIRRTLGTAQEAKTPVLVDDLKRMVSRLPEGLLGVRDRALLLNGFCGAFRRSELVALDVADAAFYSPTTATAFSLNSDPSFIYLRTIFSERWPVCRMMDRSEAPAAAADVASPDRKL